MMQDYPKVLSHGGKVGFTTAPAWLCYSPAKNNPVDAAASLASGVPASAPFTAECDQYGVFVQLLRLLGCEVQQAPEVSVLGITGSPSPRLVFHPTFVQFPHELRQSFPTPEHVVISETSSLILEGDIQVRKLKLDGSLCLKAAPKSAIRVETECVVNNAGHSMVLLEDLQGTEEALTLTEVDAMRGYRLRCNEMKSESTESMIRNIDGQENVFIFTGYHLVESEALEDTGDSTKAGGGSCAMLKSILHC